MNHPRLIQMSEDRKKEKLDYATTAGGEDITITIILFMQIESKCFTYCARSARRLPSIA
jgi:hypothetical protein